MKLLHQKLFLVGTFIVLSLIPIFDGCNQSYSAIGGIIDFFDLNVTSMEFQQSYPGWLMLLFYVMSVLPILSILFTPRNSTVIASPVIYTSATFLSLYVLNLVYMFIDAHAYYQPMFGFFLLVLYNGALWLYPSYAHRLMPKESAETDATLEPSSNKEARRDSYEVVEGDLPLGILTVDGIRAYLISHPSSQLRVKKEGVDVWTPARDIVEIMEGIRTQESKEPEIEVQVPVIARPEVPVPHPEPPEDSDSPDPSPKKGSPALCVLPQIKLWMWLALCGLLIVLVVIAFFVFGADSPTSSTGTDQGASTVDAVQLFTPVQVTMKSRREESPYATWDLRWPEVSIPTNLEMQDYLNRKFKTLANDPEYLGERVSLSAPDTWLDGSVPAEVSVEYSIEHNSQNILSVVFKRNALWHEAEFSKTDYISITMDLEKGTQIGLDDLFNPESGWKTALAALVREQLNDVLRDEIGDSESIMDYRGDDNVLVNTNSTPFTIKKDYLVLYYGEDVLVVNTPVSHARIAVPLYHMRPYFNMASPIGRILDTP